MSIVAIDKDRHLSAPPDLETEHDQPNISK